jgi:hypothetical protein
MGQAEREEDVMAKEVEIRSGNCPVHGSVQATRDVPTLGFPFVLTYVRRVLARRRPYRCPTCGAAVS